MTTWLQQLSTYAIDMVTSKKENGQANHGQTARNNTGFATEPATAVPLAEIVSLDAVRLRLGLDKHFRLDRLGAWLPPVCEKDGHAQTLQSFEHFCVGRAASVPALPVNQLAGSAAICLPGPNFVFFDSKKCHISSSSINNRAPNRHWLFARLEGKVPHPAKHR